MIGKKWKPKIKVLLNLINARTLPFRTLVKEFVDPVILLLIFMVPHPVHLEVGSYTSGVKNGNSLPFVKKLF